jgi:hypothetical protein
MGVFRFDCTVENLAAPDKSELVEQLLVDTDSKPWKIVFAQPGDLNLLGAHTLEGFGAVVDARRKKLVAAGPRLAAVTQVVNLRMDAIRRNAS